MELLAWFVGAFLGSFASQLIIDWWESRRFAAVYFALAPVGPIDRAVPTPAEIAAGVER